MIDYTKLTQEDIAKMTQLERYEIAFAMLRRVNELLDDVERELEKEYGT